MLVYTRELLLQCLQTVGGLVDQHARGEPRAETAFAAWLAECGERLARVRHPRASELAALRGRLLALRDLAGPNVRRRARAARMELLAEAERSLREELQRLDVELAGAREKLAQLLAVASRAAPLQLQNGRTRERWLAETWGALAASPEANGLARYLAHALAPSDRTQLLGELLERALEAVPVPPAREAQRA
jgi:hypothetical protein